MDRVVLAHVRRDVSLAEAIARIAPGTSAVVVTGTGDRGRLVTASDILAACNEAVDAGHDPAVVPVARAFGRRPAAGPFTELDVPIFEEGIFGAGMAGGGMSGGGLAGGAEGGMIGGGDVTNKRHEIEGIEGMRAVVITASERFAAELGSSFSICRCVGMPVHRFYPNELKVPGRCNKPHGVTVACSVFGGSL